MRSILAALWVLVLFPVVSLGKSLYVKDTSEALLRTGPSLSNKILAVLKPGQEVALVKEEGDYYVVAIPNGTQGYVLKYLMTDQSSAEARLQELEQKTQQRIQELETQAQEREKEMAALREERTRLEDAKKQAETMADKQAELISQLQAQRRTAESQQALRWFLSGAGVLLAGILLGWIWGARGRRSRRSGLNLDRF
ncbi:MAG TPA: TIGR04211 family SH3 domain-containing protein [Candidatus Binatia bacterium]|jgi:SH3 domain protein|nr:TIGR04211 family SH3 domain-containing protein [Candidatus Binatia bacterium]